MDSSSSFTEYVILQKYILWDMELTCLPTNFKMSTCFRGPPFILPLNNNSEVQPITGEWQLISIYCRRSDNGSVSINVKFTSDVKLGDNRELVVEMGGMDGIIRLVEDTFWLIENGSVSITVELLKVLKSCSLFVLSWEILSVDEEEEVESSLKTPQFNCVKKGR